MNHKFLNLVQTQLSNGFNKSSVSLNMKHILNQPKNEIIFNFPVKLSNNELQIFKGYRIQHNDILGPYKGGIRFHQDVHLDEIKALASLMSIFHLVEQKVVLKLILNYILKKILN